MFQIFLPLFYGSLNLPELGRLNLPQSILRNSDSAIEIEFKRV